MTLPSPELFTDRLNLTDRLKKIAEKYVNALLLIGIVAVFVIFNKAAFQTYFSDDDFSNLALALFVPWWAMPKAIFTLALSANVRPFGVLFYKIMGATAGFHFMPYVAALQSVHIATALMLWLFLRRLGLRAAPSALGCAFFALHMSTLTAYWKPMYVFDVFCGFWMIASLLLYQRGRFFLSLLCAWLAFKSKEMELMFPVVLFLYEWQFGETRVSGRRQWMPLIPFFLMSLSFGMQSLLLPKGPESVYTMHLNPASVWSGVTFYGEKLFYVPLSGIVISIGLLFSRSRIITFGVLAFWILLIPILGFPGRQYAAYLYVPLLAFAVAVAGVAQIKPWWAALFVVFWIPASYLQLKTERNPILAYHHEHKPYVEQVRGSLASHPAPAAVVFDGTPVDFNVWGQEGLFTYALAKYELPVYSLAQPEGLGALRQPRAVLYVWDLLRHQLHTIAYPGEGHEMSYVDFAKDNPVWQLKNGWKQLADNCRWIGPRARITLREPAGDAEFSMRVDLPGDAEGLHQVLRVSSAGQTVGEYRFVKKGVQSFSWPVSSTSEAVKDFEIQVDPAFPTSHDPLGVNVCGCGFVRSVH